jgi:hypothetical protein
MRFLILGTLILWSYNSYADSSSCYSIQNQDRKNFCLAQTKKEKSYCYSIKDSNTRNMCLALTSNQKNYCYSINEPDQKNECLGILK